MVQITVDVGGSSGWHSHPGGAIVVAKHGTLTTCHAAGDRCEATDYSAGQAFIDRPGEVGGVFNTGTDPYVLFVTFRRVLGAWPREPTSRTRVPAPVIDT
jgi:quercetin dioxygenase-like cupin family protein